MRRTAVVLLVLLAVAVAVSASSAAPKPKSKPAISNEKIKARAAAATAAANQSNVRKPALKSPIKGKTPPQPKFKGKTPAEKGTKTRIPKRMSRANYGMGSAGYSTQRAKTPYKAPAAAKTNAKGKAPAARAQGGKNKATAKPKPGKAARFRSLEAAADATEAAVAVRADKYPQKTGTGWKISSRLELTQAQIDGIAALMPKLPADKTFFHWDGFQACTRWTRAGLSQGEMEFFDSQSANMVSGGGLYMAEGFTSSASYGMFPCQLHVKAGTPIYNDDIPGKAYSAKLLSVSSITMDEKVSLGQVIPFAHSYGKGTGKSPPGSDWWVTHSNQIFSGFSGGNSKFPDGTTVSPHFTNNGDGANAKGLYSTTITNALELYAYWNRLADADTLQPQVEPEQAKNDLKGGLSWLKSFTFLFSYIDGASLFRALGVTPSDPFNVFEKARFPNYQAVYEKYINGRLGSTAASIWGVSANGVFGDGKSSKEVWAKQQLEVFLPGLYKELSQGGVMQFRGEEVRAGGDEEGKTFIATTQQVVEMKKNPYLVVVDSPLRTATNDVLVYYYYPDPLHRNLALKPKVSAALWAAMEADIIAAQKVGAEEYKKTDDYKLHTKQLMSELILDAFAAVYGKRADMDQGGLQIMMALVSIHPCTDFNGRTTRFYGVVGALESKLEPPIAFMSDFDLTSSPQLYGSFLKSASTAYFKLKLALTGELLTGVCNGAMPDHYNVGYWRQVATEALAPFGASASKPVVYDESDWEDIKSRRFVKLMDKKLGTNWTGRNSASALTPVCPTPGCVLPLVPTGGPAPAPAVDPKSCANGSDCTTCMRLSGTDAHGCGFHRKTGKCAAVGTIDNRNDEYILLEGGCAALRR